MKKCCLVMLVVCTLFCGQISVQAKDDAITEKGKESYNFNPAGGQIVLNMNIKTGVDFYVQNMVRDQYEIEGGLNQKIGANETKQYTIKNIETDIQFDIEVSNDSALSKVIDKEPIKKIIVDLSKDEELYFRMNCGINGSSSIDTIKQAYSKMKLKETERVEGTQKIQEYYFSSPTVYYSYKFTFKDGKMQKVEIENIGYLSEDDTETGSEDDAETEIEPEETEPEREPYNEQNKEANENLSQEEIDIRDNSIALNEERWAYNETIKEHLKNGWLLSDGTKNFSSIGYPREVVLQKKGTNDHLIVKFTSDDGELKDRVVQGIYVPLADNKDMKITFENGLKQDMTAENLKSFYEGQTDAEMTVNEKYSEDGFLQECQIKKNTMTYTYVFIDGELFSYKCEKS